jgi:hypothetical protein
VSGYDVAVDLAEELQCIFNNNFGYNIAEHKCI